MELTNVTGFKAFKALGYAVNKGEKALWVLAPGTVIVKDDESGESAANGEATRTSGGAKEPYRRRRRGLEPAPAQRVYFRAVPVFDLSQTEEIPDANVVDLTPPSERSSSTLAHAHGVTYKDYSRKQAEVIVDTVTHIVLANAGPDVSGETVPYISGWGETGALEAITRYAEVIDEVARTLEDVIIPKTEASTPDPETDAGVGERQEAMVAA